jgi:hypothetical protein
VSSLALLGWLVATSAVAQPLTGVAPVDTTVQQLAHEGAHTPLGRDLLVFSDESQSLAHTFAQTTELAISPLLAFTALSAWKWLNADQAGRSALPFFAQPWCWGPALVLLLLIVFKETVIARIPGAKKPLDVLQVLENKLSGLLASPIAVGALAWGIHRALAATPPPALTSLVWSTAWAAPSGSPAVALPDGVSWLFAVVGATVVYGSVWLASHTINVLILLSPFGLVDNALKLMRFGVLVMVALLGRWVPSLGAVVCGALVVLAVLTAGFSFRLMRFGWSFVVGLLGRPHDVSRERRVFAFTGPALAMPVRTAGWLSLENGEPVFRFRRGFVLPRVLRLEGPLRLERGVLHPVLLDVQGRLIFRLTPAVRGQEPAVASVLGDLPIEEQPVLKGLASFGAWLRGALSGELSTDLDVR